MDASGRLWTVKMGAIRRGLGGAADGGRNGASRSLARAYSRNRFSAAGEEVLILSRRMIRQQPLDEFLWRGGLDHGTRRARGVSFALQRGGEPVGAAHEMHGSVGGTDQVAHDGSSGGAGIIDRRGARGKPCTGL